MKFCGNCGTSTGDDSCFCGNCGYRFPDVVSTVESEAETETTSAYDKFVDFLNTYIGNDKKAELNWKTLFTDVFNRHSREEAEDIFIVGTKNTTPTVQEVSQKWPKPWLYSRVFFLFLMSFILLYICCAVFNNINAVPGLIVVGSFTVPLSGLILFLELNAYKNISIFEIARVFLLGGCASLVVTLFLFSIVGVEELDFIGAIIVGIVEEVGKLVIIYYFFQRLDKKTILSGLLVGAAVGAGFAAFESAGYAMRILLNYGWETMMDTIFLRAFLAPGGHIAWAAITGSALAIVSSKHESLAYEHLLEKDFLRLFLIPIVLHALWDSPLANFASQIFLVYILLTLVVWVVVLILINMGLSEISKIKAS